MVTRLNCWLVAMRLWVKYRGRGWAGVRRSHSLWGLLPHFGYAESVGFRRCRSIEYVPPKNQLWTSHDCGLIFEGHYVVVHYKVVAVRRWATREQALADRFFQKPGGREMTGTEHAPRALESEILESNESGTTMDHAEKNPLLIVLWRLNHQDKALEAIKNDLSEVGKTLGEHIAREAAVQGSLDEMVAMWKGSKIVGSVVSWAAGIGAGSAAVYAAIKKGFL